MQASATASNAAIISQADDACGAIESGSNPYECGSFSYIGGTVSYLNNGYELAASLSLSTFFLGTRYSSVIFNNIIFDKNLTYGSNPSAISTLIYLSWFKTLSIEGCTFLDNYVHKAIYLDSMDLEIYTNIQNNVPVDHYLTHVIVKDTTFTNNMATQNIIQAKYRSGMQNWSIENVTFSNNNCSKSMIAVTQMGQIKTKYKEDTKINTVMPDGSRQKITFPKRTVNITNLTMTNNYVGTLLDLQKNTNIAITDCTISENGESEAGLTPNEMTTAALISDAGSYISQTFSSEKAVSNTGGIVLLNGGYSLTANNITFTDNWTTTSNVGMKLISDVTGTISFTSITMTGNQGGSVTYGTGLFVDTAVQVDIDIFTASNNISS